MQELNLLREKLNGLIRAYAALRADRDGLQKDIDRQGKLLDQQKNEIRLLEKQLDLQVMNRAAEQMDDKSRDVFRQQLDKVIAQLEKNIQLLK